MRKNIAFFDIDGTLIGFNGTSLVMPESTKRAIKEFRERGNLAFICSGRQIRFILEMFGTDMFDGYISANGTQIMLGDKVVFERTLSKDRIEYLKNAFDELGISCIFNDAFHGYSYDMDESRIKRYNSQFKGNDYILKRWNMDNIKASSLDIFYKDEDALEKCREYFKESLIFNPHGPNMSADVSLKEWGKADAIEYISEYLKIPMDNTYAFGDGHNDIEMIKRVNTGIAMGNAVEELKEVADYITSDIFEDGIERAMKTYKLI
ncbi:HAD family hydrolase [Clostridium paridis]|uniref:HAD family hydrolase n=1 Tax=Clostridium paridis TaxID=2803863 RepID=A0A937K2H7_9CLOT|nr:HAD family hydrolase [Clostridium paridis]MBL4930657.1 HAD family hydrolase [Clostridium paridis]